MSGQHCRSTLAQHMIYRYKQYYTNVDGWARRSSFAKYIRNVSYNELNVLPGQHCSSTLAHHSIYRLKRYYTNVDGWARPSSFVKHIGDFSYNDSNVVPCQHFRSTLAQHYVYRLKTVLYECWLLSSSIIIRQIYRKLFLQWIKCCARSSLQLNTSTTFGLSFKNNIIRMLMAKRAHHHSSYIKKTFLKMFRMLCQVNIAAQR